MGKQSRTRRVDAMNKPNILIFDIETSLMEVYTFQIGYNLSISYNQIIKDTKVICISYKWKGRGKVESLQWNEKTHDDSVMLKQFNKIAGSADALVAHNGKNFDVKKIRGAIAMRGLAIEWCETPVLDTLNDYRRAFSLSSNKLDAVARALNLGHKNQMTLQDWIDVQNDKPGALKKMVKYCKKDTLLLEKVYNRLDHYVPDTMQKVQIFTKKKDKLNLNTCACICKECGSDAVIKWGFYKVNGTDCQRYLCKQCKTTIKPHVATKKKAKK